MTGRISEMLSGSKHAGPGTGFHRDEKKVCLVPETNRRKGLISELLSGSRHGGPGIGFDRDKNTLRVWFQTTVTAFIVA